MTSKRAIAAGVIAVAIWVVCWWRQQNELPLVRFADGGEFRVLQILYTAEPSQRADHYLRGSPHSWFWLYGRLPVGARSWLPSPKESQPVHWVPDRPAISVWWEYIRPDTGRAEIGPTDYVPISLDSGETIDVLWPEPAVECRQILLTDPPPTSRRLHFRVLAAEGRPVEFSIKNPAYRKSSVASEDALHSFAFYIQCYRKDDDGGQRIKAVASPSGHSIGFELVLDPYWDSEHSHHYLGTGSIYSTGKDSDGLLKHLAELFRVPPPHHAMREKTSFCASAFGFDPRDLPKGNVAINVSRLSPDGMSSCECFIDIDLPARKLTLRERSPHYRAALIKALEASP